MKKLIIILAAVLTFNFQLFTFNCSAQWQQVGLDSSNVILIATDSTNIFVSTGEGVFLSTDDGNSWTNKGLFGVNSIVIDGTNIFATTYDNGVFLSSNNGNSWTNIGLSNDTITSLAVSGTNIFAGADESYNGVYLSTDTGGSWTGFNMWNGLTDSHVTSLLINGNNIFAGTEGGVFLSTDSGSNWTEVNNGLTNFWITSIASYGNNIFAGANNTVFLSTNNGNLWIPTDSVNSTVWDFDTSGTNIFAATSFGVYLSTDSGNSWTSVDNNGFLWAYGILSIAIKGNYIYAGTGGNGIWRRPLSEILGIKENFNEANMLFPNPTNGKFTISQTNIIKSIEICNVMGEIVYKSQASNSKLQIPNSKLQIDISAQPKGIYIVKVNNGVNTQIEKIVIQ